MYENRIPSEGINVTRVHPLKQFFQLAIAALVLIIALVFFLQLSGAWLAKRIPFAFELDVMQELDIAFGDDEKHADMVAYLNELALQLSAHMAVPEGMQFRVHYSDDDVFNAFATVGGNLLFYKSLLEKMPNENTLAMVMAHEIAHVVHRDPIASLGGGVVSTLGLLALTGSTGSAGSMLSNAGALTSMQFTRKMESVADEAAVAALHGHYGHVNGSATLFEIFSQQQAVQGHSTDWLDGFASTHPTEENRIQDIHENARANGWSTSGSLTPLPAQFSDWM